MQAVFMYIKIFIGKINYNNAWEKQYNKKLLIEKKNILIFAASILDDGRHGNLVRHSFRITSGKTQFLLLRRKPGVNFTNIFTRGFFVRKFSAKIFLYLHLRFTQSWYSQTCVQWPSSNLCLVVVDRWLCSEVVLCYVKT